MSKDQFQNKYDEIFREIKEEKMDWNFEDFLQQTQEGNTETKDVPVIPLKKKPSFPKWGWLAGCGTADPAQYRLGV